MNLLDKYLYAISKKLPYKGRKEIEMELKSLLLDEMESKYGENPTDNEVESFIAAYGTPREVANRYKSDNLVIGSGFTDIYFMIAKIIVFAMAIAFTVTFVVQLFTGELGQNGLVFGVIAVPFQVLQASVSGIGFLTIVFIIMTRVNKEQNISIDDDWTPAELKDIKIGPEAESKISSAFSVFFIIVFIVLINVVPGIITLAETSFEVSTIKLGHYVNIDVFVTYLAPLTLVWLGELVYHAYNLYNGPSKMLALYDLLLEIAGAALIIIIFFDMNMYVDYTGLLGFRGIFGVVGLINFFEILGKAYKFVRYYVF